MIKGLAAASINPHFLEHVAEHGLSFGTTEEFNFRQNIFLQKDAEHKESNANPEHTFTLGHNFMSTWTHDEYKSILGYKALDKATTEEAELTVGIPTSIDWRTKGAVLPVKNQGQCGSCWAFSTVCSLEGHWQIQTGNLVSLSEQELVDCDSSCYGCGGGLQTYAMKWVRANGICQEKDYGYTARNGSCKKSSCTAVLKVEKTYNVKPHSAEHLLSAIAQGPVSVTVEADRTAFQSYQSGVLNSAACGTNLDHAITGIGYGTESGQQYYIIRNSWGSNWGVGGYIKIATESGRSKGICGIQQESVWSKVVKA